MTGRRGTCHMIGVYDLFLVAGAPFYSAVEFGAIELGVILLHW